MSLREAKQRAETNGCYLVTLMNGKYAVGKHKWSKDERLDREFITDCIETAAIRSGALS
jgi:hypothetical protein